MEVVYTMAACNFTDINTFCPWACVPWALGVYISKICHSNGIFITYTTFVLEFKGATRCLLCIFP